ncbi:hypothetical protein [Paraburkholderia tropica]|uniref:hypothetical protein n=1 Tax=Paraburkholderia tropica TaxID=92647 RepID=UPI002AB1FD17|nr:hypothetical protein [Paraburkholderia tropica]
MSNVSRAAGFRKTILAKVMRKIGFAGGSSICELGTASDVNLFFDLLRFYVEDEHPDTDWTLLTDRLYRRYLRSEETGHALALMERVRAIFAEKPAHTSVEWDQQMLADHERSWLDATQPTLADVFQKYFASFAYCVESAKLNYEAFKAYPSYSYEPVRTVISDLPGFARDKNKPLEEYDALEGKPMWLR